jgi:hypothetical protein
MANVLNRKTKLYLESVNTPEYDPAEWLINPDVSALSDIPSSFWEITEDDQVIACSENNRIAYQIQAPFQGLTLEAAIRLKMDMVNALRDEKLNGGWLYNGEHYDSDAISRSNMNGVMTLIGTGYILPDGFTFRAKNNTDVPYHNDTFRTFYQASCVWVEMVYKTSWYYKGVIKNLTSIPDIANFDFSQGWPEGYTPG